MEKSKQLKNVCELNGDELKNVASGIVDKDEARCDTRLRCTNCNATMWSGDVPDKNICPFCGARGTLIIDK